MRKDAPPPLDMGRRAVSRDAFARFCALVVGSLVAGYLIVVAIKITDGFALQDLVAPFQPALAKLFLAAAVVGGFVESILHPILKRIGWATLLGHAIAGALAPTLIVLAFRASFGEMDDFWAAARFQLTFIAAGAVGGMVYHMIWRRLT